MIPRGHETTSVEHEDPTYGEPASATRIQRGVGRALFTFGRSALRAITWDRVISVAVILVGLYAYGYAAACVGEILWHEAHFPYNVDVPLYWTVGRGILEGHVPYRDLFETKPPGIFLFSALSLWLTDDYWLTNVGHMGSLLVVALSPFAFLFRATREPGRRLSRFGVWLALSSLVLMLTAFTGRHSYEVQTETFGLAGTVFYMLLIGQTGRWAFVGRSAGIMLAIGLKEPFLLLIPAIYLVLRTTPRRDISDFWGPLASAGLAGTLFLASMGWLDAFVNIYLRTMTSGHVKLGGSPLDRALLYELTWDSLKHYSPFLPYVMLYVVFVYVTSGAQARDGSLVKGPTQRIQIVFVTLLLACLAVGMGGSFYAHHYVLAVPLYLALIFSLLRELPYSGERAWFAPGIVGLVALLPTWVPLTTFEASFKATQEADANARHHARVIDSFLDRVHVDRYLWLGPGGYPPLPFTRHVPQGPAFFQQVAMFEGKYSSWIVSEFEKSLSKTRVIVLFQHTTGPLDAKVKRVLKRDFERVPATHLPPQFPYQILVRKGIDMRLRKE